jgi:hypothetical protein
LLQLRLADAVRVARRHPAYFGRPTPRSQNVIDDLTPGQLVSLTEHHLEHDASQLGPSGKLHDGRRHLYP